MTPQPIPGFKDGGGTQGDVQLPPWRDGLPIMDAGTDLVGQRDKSLPLPGDGAGPDAGPSVPDLVIDAPGPGHDTQGEGALTDGFGEGGPAKDIPGLQEGQALDTLPTGK